jgi:CRISPR/Cas system endoribonuclease Cas6 (RAMP superfamily)
MRIDGAKEKNMHSSSRCHLSAVLTSKTDSPQSASSVHFIADRLDIYFYSLFKSGNTGEFRYSDLLDFLFLDCAPGICSSF